VHWISPSVKEKKKKRSWG